MDPVDRMTCARYPTAQATVEPGSWVAYAFLAGKSGHALCWYYGRVLRSLRDFAVIEFNDGKQGLYHLPWCMKNKNTANSWRVVEETDVVHEPTDESGSDSD
jgi:hypothetical protein